MLKLAEYEYEYEYDGDDGDGNLTAVTPFPGDGSPGRMSARATEQRITLAQASVPDGTNEIATIPELLRMLDLATDFAGMTFTPHESVETGHGRHEERYMTVIADPFRKKRVRELRTGRTANLAKSIERTAWAHEPNREDDPEYIVRLVGQVVKVSLETVKIVNGLPAEYS